MGLLDVVARQGFMPIICRLCADYLPIMMISSRLAFECAIQANP
jgi:hypothetical protein